MRVGRKINKVYAVIDTNVIVSALWSKYENSSTVIVINALFSGKIVPLYNIDILKEYHNVLSRPKFPFKSETINSTIQFIKDNGIDSDRINSEEYFPDKDDIVFYEVALSREDSFLVTGNKKHFPQNPIVISPAEMVEMLGL